MAAPDMNVSRIGADDQGSDKRKMFLRVFGGEVLTQFEETNVAMERTFTRTIPHGKSTIFPNVGRVTAEYHVPGTYLTGLQIAGGETTITVDDVLISHVSIAEVDELMAHYDFRGPYATELGRALARQMDKHILQMGCLAAGASNVITGEDGGTEINHADISGTADFVNSDDDLVAALTAAATAMDEKDVPDEERYVYVKPATYRRLANIPELVSADFANQNQNARESGQFSMVQGLKVVKTNNLPTTTVSNGTIDAGYNNKYAGNFSNTIALIMHPSAVGTVKLMDVKMGTDGFEERTQSQLFTAKYLVGHGLLRPQAAARIIAA